VTTIVGIQGKNWSLLGADSRITDDSTIYALPKNLSKIIEVNDNLWVAVAGDLRAINIVRSNLASSTKLLSVRKAPNNQDGDDYFLGNYFIPEMRKIFSHQGYEKTTEGLSSVDSEFLISYYGRIYAVGADYSWVQDSRGLYSIGSGGDIALGALSALASTPMMKSAARKMATRALEIACSYNADSSPPYVVKVWSET